MIPEDEQAPVEAGVEEAVETVAEDPVASLEADILKWRELAMRTAADLENFRKRAAREREEAMRYANQGLLEELLPVLDNFEMGMQAAAKDSGSMIYIGMDMVRRQLQDFLAGQGLKEVSTEGAFDPNLHEAVSQVVEEGKREGEIVRVVRRGFLLRDRLLRPASVVVAKAAETEGGEG